MSSKILLIIVKTPSYLAKGLILLYQYTISPLLGKCCRFYPSCSDYALEAFSVWGFWKGIFKVIVRIGKCHPWHPGGYDPACDNPPEQKTL